MKKKRKTERGIALVMVLGVLAVTSVLAAHMSAISNLSLRLAKASEFRGELKYASESALDYGYWMWLNDRKSYRGDHSQLHTMSITRESSDVWRADSRAHALEFNEIPVNLQVKDADAGHIIESEKDLRKLRNSLDPGPDAAEEELRERIGFFMDALADYMDPNDAKKLNGMERDDYEAEGLNGLPRDGKPEYREEMLWIPDAVELLGNVNGSTVFDLEAIRLIPPKGMKFSRSSKPSFYSVSESFIAQEASLTEDEARQVVEARQQALEESMSLIEIMDPVLYGKISSKFSFNESNAVRFYAYAFTKDKAIKRVAEAVREDRIAQLRFGDRRFHAYWEKINF